MIPPLDAIVGLGRLVRAIRTTTRQLAAAEPDWASIAAVACPTNPDLARRAAATARATDAATQRREETAA